jgi:integrase
LRTCWRSTGKRLAHRRSARLIGYRIGSLLPWWGDKTVAAINVASCRAYASTKTAQGAQGDLKVLRAAAMHWNKAHAPLAVVPAFWLPPNNPPRERWLTKAARLLRAAKPYQHLRRFILLGLYTGSRPGVLLALRWDQIDGEIMHRTPIGQRQDQKKRAPRVRLGRRIMAHLRRWRRLMGHGAFMFVTSTARPLPHRTQLGAR